MMGPTRYVHRATDIRPGDRLILTKHVGLEEWPSLPPIVRTSSGEALGKDGVDEAVQWLNSISVLQEAKTLRDIARFLHDPTEGEWGENI